MTDKNAEKTVTYRLQNINVESWRSPEFGSPEAAIQCRKQYNGDRVGKGLLPHNFILTANHEPIHGYTVVYAM